MRLLQYLTEKTRSVKKDINFVIKNIDKYKESINNYINGGLILHRRSPTYNNDLLYVEPKKHIRKSKNTKNYYTLVLDNSNKWKGYPKRSQSIICSVNNFFNIGSGSYIIFPQNNAKIGVCPSFDFWVSFKRFEADALNDYMESILNVVGLSNKDNNISEFKQACKKFDEYYQKNGYFLDPDDKEDITVLSYLNIINFNNLFETKYKGDLYSWFEDLFDPKENNFKLTDITNIDYTTKGAEVWTDSPSLIVSMYYIDSFIKEVKDKI